MLLASLSVLKPKLNQFNETESGGSQFFINVAGKSLFEQ